MKRKRKRNLYHLWFCFAMLLFLAVPFKVKAETATTPVSISVQYGQTEARTILNMINEMRTSSTDAWYWKQDDTTKTYCTNLQPLQYDYDLEKTAMQRAAEIAIIYSHTRPNNKDTFSAFYENSVYYTYAGENIAAGYGTLTVSTTAGGKITSFTPVRDTDEICLILNSTVSESVMYTTMAFTIGWKILHTEIKLIPPL